MGNLPQPIMWLLYLLVFVIVFLVVVWMLRQLGVVV
jgi:hypothetical protein